MNVYTYAFNAIKPASSHLESLRNYTGCGEFIRKVPLFSVKNGNNSNRLFRIRVLKMKMRLGMHFVLPFWNWKNTTSLVWNYVGLLSPGFKISDFLEEVFPNLLKFFGQGPIVERMVSHQASVRILTDILHFVSQFDEIKVRYSTNEYSYHFVDDQFKCTKRLFLLPPISRENEIQLGRTSHSLTLSFKLVEYRREWWTCK